MTKNTFLIRAAIEGNATTGGYQQSEIDLGSYTNLGSSKPEVLRIHKIHFLMRNDSNQDFPSMAGNDVGSLFWQICTQSQTDLVGLTDDSYVSGGGGSFRNPDSNGNPPTQAVESFVLPQDFVGGFVVAVPSLFLGVTQTADWTENATIEVILECTTEAMSKANAVSLAISQQ
jgi:hypothetical protein